MPESSSETPQPHDATHTTRESPTLPLCPHCEATLTGRYCAQCGQDNRHDRLNTKTLFGDFFESITDLDWPILRTVIDLTRRPGQACLDYKSGHRKKYTNPLRYCFLFAAIMVLVTLATGHSPSDGLRSAMGATTLDSLPADADPEVRERMEKIYEAVDFFGRNMHYLTLATFPAMTLALMLLFRAQRYTFAEHAVYFLFVTGHMFAILSIFLPFGLLGTTVGSLTFQIANFGYQAWAACRYYRVGIWSSAWRIAALFGANVVINGTIGAVGGFLYAVLG